MLREYGGYAFGSWALKSLGRRLRTCKRIVLYERSKARKIAAVLGRLVGRGARTHGAAVKKSDERAVTAARRSSRSNRS